MRTGSWLLMAGLALLATGIVTAPRDAPPKSNQRSHVFSVTDVQAIDIGASRIDRIVLDNVPEITLDYRIWSPDRDTSEPSISSRASDGVLTLEASVNRWGGATLTMPSTLGNLRSDDHLFVTARQPVGTLRMEGQAVQWQGGDASMLDVHLRPAPTRGCLHDVASRTPHVWFQCGPGLRARCLCAFPPPA